MNLPGCEVSCWTNTQTTLAFITFADISPSTRLVREVGHSTSKESIVVLGTRGSDLSLT